MTERAIPDVWEVFGQQRGRRNSWQKMMTEEEKAVTELFNDLHIHARSYTPGNDSAVDLDLSDDDLPIPNKSSSQRKIDMNNDKNKCNQYASGWQNIEKHLSMKKTIRKKMMRDLQQAFVDGEDGQQWNNVQMAPHKSGEPNILDLLKEDTNKNQWSSNGSVVAESRKDGAKKPGFWKKLTMKRSKR